MEIKSFLQSNTMRGLILGVLTFLGGHFGWLQGFAVPDRDWETLLISIVTS